MSAIEVVPFTQPYHAQVVQLISSIQRGEFAVDITVEQQPDLAQIDSFYQRGRGGFWVALAGDTVVGTIGLVDIGCAQLALRKMFVAVSHRGAGVAARLLDAALDHAAGCGIDDIFLGTIDRMKAAARFYDKHGFVAVEPSELPPSFPVMAVDNRFYHRSLRRPPHELRLALLADRFAVCRLDPRSPLPAWAGDGALTSATRSSAELSIVCPAARVPADVAATRDWRAFAVDGPLDFALVGVLASLVEPLARRRISVFCLSTFDTDYLLVRDGDVACASAVLRAAGHQLR